MSNHYNTLGYQKFLHPLGVKEMRYGQPNPSTSTGVINVRFRSELTHFPLD